MRIISKQNDFYDSLMSFDKNDKVWVRNLDYFTFNRNSLEKASSFSTVINGENVDVNVLSNNNESNSAFEKFSNFFDYYTYFSNSFTIKNKKEFADVTMNYLFFCGKIYPVINVSFSDKNKKSLNLYDFESFYAFIDEFKVYNSRLSFSRDLNVFSSIFKTMTGADFDAYNQYFKSPIVFLENGNPNIFIKDASLSNIEFYKVFPINSCFQTIEMYINNNLLELDDREEFCDKTKIVSHGFDLKSSFRKGKTKKK